MFFQRVLLAGFVVAIMAQATLGGEFVTPPGKTAPGPRPRVVSDGSGARAMRDMMQEVVLRTIGVGVAVFTCVTCNKQFGRACELGRHYSSPGSSGCVNPNTAGVACVRRKTYTFLQKRDVLFFYDELIREGHFNPVDVLAVRAGVPHSCIHDWIRDRAQIFHLAGTDHYARKRKFRIGVPEFPEAEFQLYLRFVWRRKHLKRRVGYKWIQRNMLELVRIHHHTQEAAEFKAGNTWCRKWCRRWSVTNQCRTNTKTTSLQDRLPQIRRFHQFLIYGLQRSEPQRCPKYGRFPPSRMFHMDQVPLPFSPNTRKTMNPRGDQCVLAEPAGDGGKRFATLQITICADPSQPPVNIEIYFRGTGARLSEEERAHYENLPGVTVRFQPKAWADENICIQYLRAFRGQVADRGEVMLGMDNHGSQRTELCRKFMEHFMIVPAYTPATCTDCISPVDRHVGQTIKEAIYQKYEDAFDKDYDSWLLDRSDGGLSSTKKRMLVATWTSEAWKAFTESAKSRRLVAGAFVKTGFLVAKDGSENSLIELHEKRMPAGTYDF